MSPASCMRRAQPAKKGIRAERAGMTQVTTGTRTYLRLGKIIPRLCVFPAHHLPRSHRIVQTHYASITTPQPTSHRTLLRTHIHSLRRPLLLHPKWMLLPTIAKKFLSNQGTTCRCVRYLHPIHIHLLKSINLWTSVFGR